MFRNNLRVRFLGSGFLPALIRWLESNFNGPHIECNLLKPAPWDMPAVAALVRSEDRLNCPAGEDKRRPGLLCSSRGAARNRQKRPPAGGFAVRRSRDPTLTPDSFSVAALRT